MKGGHAMERSRTSVAPSVMGIVVRGVTKELKGRLILDRVDLEVPRGTLAVLKGSNGTGKTTLVRTLATVVAPNSGTAVVNGFDVVNQSLEVRRSIGVSFANDRSLYWRINAFENLELFGKIAGLSKAAISRRSADLLEQLRLVGVATLQVSRLSTGQRQRLMVARALLTDPAVILLDEPFRGIDEEGLHSIVELVTDRVATGATALIVAPLIDAIVPVADATYEIREGVIRQTGNGIGSGAFGSTGSAGGLVPPDPKSARPVGVPSLGQTDIVSGGPAASGERPDAGEPLRGQP